MACPATALELLPNDHVLALLGDAVVGARAQVRVALLPEPVDQRDERQHHDEEEHQRDDQEDHHRDSVDLILQHGEDREPRAGEQRKGRGAGDERPGAAEKVGSGHPEQYIHLNYQVCRLGPRSSVHGQTVASPELNNTSCVILGLLRLTGEKTGYELKALVDSSTQFFWPASYGRIYPELHRLAEQGLVSSRDEPQGGRPRKLYALTAEGERALADWLARSEDLIFELRDEGVLRIFLAEASDLEQTLSTVRAMRLHHQRQVTRLRELEPFIAEAYPDEFPLMTLQGGIEFHAWYAEWCRSMEERLSAEPPRQAPSTAPDP